MLLVGGDGKPPNHLRLVANFGFYVYGELIEEVLGKPDLAYWLLMGGVMWPYHLCATCAYGSSPLLNRRLSSGEIEPICWMTPCASRSRAATSSTEIAWVMASRMIREFASLSFET